MGDTPTSNVLAAPFAPFDAIDSSRQVVTLTVTEIPSKDGRTMNFEISAAAFDQLVGQPVHVVNKRGGFPTVGKVLTVIPDADRKTIAIQVSLEDQVTFLKVIGRVLNGAQFFVYPGLKNHADNDLLQFIGMPGRLILVDGAYDDQNAVKSGDGVSAKVIAFHAPLDEMFAKVRAIQAVLAEVQTGVGGMQSRIADAKESIANCELIYASIRL